MSLLYGKSETGRPVKLEGKMDKRVPIFFTSEEMELFKSYAIHSITIEKKEYKNRTYSTVRKNLIKHYLNTQILQNKIRGEVMDGLSPLIDFEGNCYSLNFFSAFEIQRNNQKDLDTDLKSLKKAPFRILFSKEEWMRIESLMNRDPQRYGRSMNGYLKYILFQTINNIKQ